MMIDHHRVAVHMSMTCIDKAVHNELRRLCERIMERQAEEISVRWRCGSAVGTATAVSSSSGAPSCTERVHSVRSFAAVHPLPEP